MTGLVTRHAKPELAQFLLAFKQVGELHIEGHRLFFEIDRGTENISHRCSLRSPPQIRSLSHTLLLAKLGWRKNRDVQAGEALQHDLLLPQQYAVFRIKGYDRHTPTVIHPHI